MAKFLLTNTEGKFFFITAENADDALVKARKAYPYETFVNVEFYYDI